MVVAAFNQEKALVIKGVLHDYEPSDSLRLKHLYLCMFIISEASKNVQVADALIRFNKELFPKSVWLLICSNDGNLVHIMIMTSDIEFENTFIIQ